MNALRDRKVATSDEGSANNLAPLEGRAFPTVLESLEAANGDAAPWDMPDPGVPDPGWIGVSEKPIAPALQMPTTGPAGASCGTRRTGFKVF